jgi:hypothetical protein
MKIEELVPITLVCLGCRSEQVVQIPYELGIKSSRYSWECFACQEKRYGILGRGRRGDHKVRQAGRGGNGNEPLEREGR